MINFKINSKPYTIAQDWPELTADQLWPVIPYAYTSRENVKGRLDLLRLLVPALKVKLLRKMSDQQRIDLIALTDWVFDKVPVVTGIEFFTFKGIKYYLPKPGLDDTVVVEFAMADLLFKDFVKESDAKLLDKLVATLCRPQKPLKDQRDPMWDGVERHRYNGAIAERMTAEFSKLPFSIKVTVLHHFAQMQKVIHDSYDIFTTGSGEGGAGGFDIGWMAVAFNLAEQGVFGDFDKTCYTNIHTICLYLHKKRLERASGDEK